MAIKITLWFTLVALINFHIPSPVLASPDDVLAQYANHYNAVFSPTMSESENDEYRQSKMSSPIYRENFITEPAEGCPVNITELVLDEDLLQFLDGFDVHNTETMNNIESILCKGTMECLISSFHAFTGVKGPCGFGYKTCKTILEALDGRADGWMHVLEHAGKNVCGLGVTAVKAFMTGGKSLIKKGIMDVIGCAAALGEEIPGSPKVCENIDRMYSTYQDPIKKFFCNSFDRGFGIPMQCHPEEEQFVVLCYPNCMSPRYSYLRDGNNFYRSVGEFCWADCAEGYTDLGLGCAKDLHYYFKHSFRKPTDSSRPLHYCPDHHPSFENQLCYKRCPPTHHGFGPRCIKN